MVIKDWQSIKENKEPCKCVDPDFQDVEGALRCMNCGGRQGNGGEIKTVLPSDLLHKGVQQQRGEVQAVHNVQQVQEEEDSPYGSFFGINLWPKHKKEKMFICEHVLYENDTTCILGKAGKGKSVFVLHLAHCLTSATPFLEAYHITKECGVAYIQLEGEREETCDRSERMNRAVPLYEKNFVHICLPNAAMDTEYGYKQVVTSLRKAVTEKHIKKYNVIIFDPLYMTIEGSIKEAHVATAWCKNMRRIKDEFGNCGLVVIGHPNKESYYDGKVVVKKDNPIPGAKEFNGFFNSIYHFVEDKGKKLHYLTNEKDRSAKCVKKLTLRMVQPVPLYYTIMGKKGKCDSNVLVQMLTSYLREQSKVTRTMMLDEFEEDYCGSSVDKAIRRIKENGNLDTFKEEGVWWYKWK